MKTTECCMVYKGNSLFQTIQKTRVGKGVLPPVNE